MCSGNYNFFIAEAWSLMGMGLGKKLRAGVPDLKGLECHDKRLEFNPTGRKELNI